MKVVTQEQIDAVDSIRKRSALAKANGARAVAAKLFAEYLDRLGALARGSILPPFTSREPDARLDPRK